MAKKFNYQQIQGVKGNINVTDEFIKAVEKMAERLESKPEYFLAAMSFETGGSFNPAIQNKIGATGLIQFLKPTAKGLGTTTDELKNMSSVKQLEFVENILPDLKVKSARSKPSIRRFFQVRRKNPTMFYLRSELRLIK